jgi:hypothetical protein
MSERSLLNTYREQPRAIRWLVLAVVFILAFLVWDSTVASLARHYSDEANKIERDVQATARSEDLVSEIRRNRRVIQQHGMVQPPKRNEDAATALTGAINEILSEFRVNDDSFEMGGGDVPSNAGRGYVDSGYKISAIGGSLSFESSPEIAMQIVAALENHPDIEAVTQVRMTRQSRGVVKVSIEMSAWVQSQSRRSSR